MRQARSTITPTGRERVFGEDEILVSKTDVASKITYANIVGFHSSRRVPDRAKIAKGCRCTTHCWPKSGARRTDRLD